jgi:hypothetical protein
MLVVSVGGLQHALCSWLIVTRGAISGATQDELWEKKAQKVFQYVHQTTSALAKADYPALALRLFLQCALAADNMRFEAIAYEFFTRVCA